MIHPALTFVDAAGRTWHCVVTLHEILECQRTFGVDLMDLLDAEKGPAVNNIDKAECLVRIVADQLKEQGVSVSDFCRSIASEVHLRQAFEAMYAAVMAYRSPGDESLNLLLHAREALRIA
jgi:hypothetical protein